MSTGKIVQVIGAVVDIEFPEDAVPKINDALIAATAIRHDLTLVTCNVRDFAELNAPLLNPFSGKA